MRGERRMCDWLRGTDAAGRPDFKVANERGRSRPTEAVEVDGGRSWLISPDPFCVRWCLFSTFPSLGERYNLANSEAKISGLFRTGGGPLKKNVTLISRWVNTLNRWTSIREMATANRLTFYSVFLWSALLSLFIASLNALKFLQPKFTT